jgi:hypothetical protein
MVVVLFGIGMPSLIPILMTEQMMAIMSYLTPRVHKSTKLAILTELWLVLRGYDCQIFQKRKI